MTAETEAVAAMQAGRVLIQHAERLAGNHAARPDVVVGFVIGLDGKFSRVDLMNGAWTCACTAVGCAHVLTVQYVTGYARPPMLTNLGAPAADVVRAGAAKQRLAASKLRKNGNADQARIHTAAAAQLDDVAADLNPALPREERESA